MKILSHIENIDSRYHVQITTLGFTANEEELLAQFGEPTVDVGSIFTGSAARPGQANTTVTITPVAGGSGAVATAVVNDAGGIDSISVSNGGSGYASGATVALVGDGTGAAATANVTGGVITSITVTTAGTGYHVSPVPVTFDLPPAIRRLRTDSPFVQVFDLNDTVNADVQAKVWSDTIVNRLTSAKLGLIAQNSAFTGDTLITV